MAEAKKQIAQVVKVNLTGYKSERGGKVDEGEYDVMVMDAEMREASTGNPMLMVWFKITTGEYRNTVVVDRITITDRSLWRIEGFLSACRIPTPSEQLSIPVKQLINRRLRVLLKDGDEYQGRVKSEVKDYMLAKVGGSAAEAAAASDGLEEFASDGGTATELPEPDPAEAPQEQAAEKPKRAPRKAAEPAQKAASEPETAEAVAEPEETAEAAPEPVSAAVGASAVEVEIDDL